MAKTKETTFEANVQFGGVSIGDNTARLGMSVDRKLIALSRANDFFCDRRLIGRIVLGLHDEDSDQETLEGMEDVDHEVAGAFDVKGFRVSSGHITFGATFSLKEIDISELAKFSKGAGRLIVTSAGLIPEEPKPEPPIKGSARPIARATGPWRKVRLDTLFPPEKTICKALLNAGIETVGQMADYTASGKLLSDLDGLGPKKVEELEARMVEFWKANPDADNQPEAAAAAAE